MSVNEGLLVHKTFNRNVATALQLFKCLIISKLTLLQTISYAAIPFVDGAKRCLKMSRMYKDCGLWTSDSCMY